MSDWVTVVPTTVTAALLFATSSTLKHMSASAVPVAPAGRPHRLLGFVRATVVHRLWLLGIACDAGALALQVVALHLGTLVVVQPLLISGLVFALLLRRATGRQHVSGRQLGWAGVLVAALGGFVALTATGPTAAAADRLPAVVAGVGVLVATAGCVALGRSVSSRGGAAALLGAGVGIVYAATAALLKALTDIATSHPLHLLVAWQTYLTIVAGAVGLLLNQLAFQAGPLAASLPATAAVDPLVSIVLGLAVFDEHVRDTVAGGAVPSVLLAAVVVCIVQLARGVPAENDHANQITQNAPPTRQ